MYHPSAWKMTHLVLAGRAGRHAPSRGCNSRSHCTALLIRPLSVTKGLHQDCRSSTWLQDGLPGWVRTKKTREGRLELYVAMKRTRVITGSDR